MVKGQGTTGPFAQNVSRPVKLSPEHNPWFWNPNRSSVVFAPRDFRKELHAISDTLEVTWNPIMERWLVWDRCWRIQQPICSGWRLLFIHKDVDGGYLPLDQRLFARLFAASADVHGSAMGYFNRVASEMERDQAKAAANATQDAVDQAMEVFEHSQIKNINSGSNFSKYHS